jgi:geranylgeranyl reductase family protein
MDFDVIVSGAGPGGSTAAREIAVRGHRVLLLDRERFPRDKPCGGAVSPRTEALLPFDLSPVVEHVVTGVVLGDLRRGLVLRDACTVLARMTQRIRLDALLVDEARQHGVDVRDGQLVQAVTERPDRSFEVRVATDRHTPSEVHTARVVVGADGANGCVGPALGFERPRRYGVALVGHLPVPDGLPEWLRGRMALTVPVMAGGYGWLFPKGDHINIGVGGWAAADVHPREALDLYARAFGWSIDGLRDVRGHRLPLRHRGMAIARGGAALVGDAAGLVDPLLGEGMYSAVYSGIAVARAVDAYLKGAAPDLLPYQREVDRNLAPSLERSQGLAEVLTAWAGPLNWAAMHSNTVWGTMRQVVASEMAARGGTAGRPPLAVTALRPLAALARRVAARHERVA